MPSNNDKIKKTKLHPRNRNREMYDLEALIVSLPELEKYVNPNKFGVKSIDFSDPIAVKLLNTAILNHYYGIKYWDFPNENLCPPIPGRADYMHCVADLLAENNNGKVPIGNAIKCLDIGVGASCIYPLIGVVEYGWSFIGADIDPKSIASAENIVNSNSELTGMIECRLQTNPNNIFEGIVRKDDRIDVTISNPPFHASEAEAKSGTKRKTKNLLGNKKGNLNLNFSGNKNELIYNGGEFQFIKSMISESKKFSTNCTWFTTLVSKQSNLKGIYIQLEKIGVRQVKTIPMGTGNKISRIVAWSFFK